MLPRKPYDATMLRERGGPHVATENEWYPLRGRIRFSVVRCVFTVTRNSGDAQVQPRDAQAQPNYGLYGIL